VNASQAPLGHPADDIPSDANSAMLDPQDARRLWQLSERLLA
jgi:hypothetical protein